MGIDYVKDSQQGSMVRQAGSMVRQAGINGRSGKQGSMVRQAGINAFVRQAGRPDEEPHE